MHTSRFEWAISIYKELGFESLELHLPYPNMGTMSRFEEAVSNCDHRGFGSLKFHLYLPNKGTMSRFEEAISIYEELGFESLESRLLKYSADEYLFRSALCHLAVDW